MSKRSNRPTIGKTRKRLRIDEILNTFTTQPISNLMWTEEYLSSYGNGGCHPVRLGDTFKHGRYKVLRKLGVGDSSTVWLVRDTQTKTRMALKIIIADDSSRTSRHQAAALEALHRNPATALLVPALYDDFVYDGPNGAHRVLVMELLGPSLRKVIESFHGERMNPMNLLRIARQVLEAIATFHESGFAHGDIDANNVVFSLHNSRNLSDKAFLKTLSPRKTAHLLRKDGSSPGSHLPHQLVETTGWPTFIDKDEDEEDVRLVDVCRSFRVNDRIPSCREHLSPISPPETFFEDTFDYRVDLWGAGLVIYALIFAVSPWMHFGGDACLIASMTTLIGPLPSEWEPQWQQMRAASNHAITLRDPSQGRVLELQFQKAVPEPALQRLLAVIDGLLRFRPEERISARDALKLLDEDGSASDETC